VCIRRKRMRYVHIYNRISLIECQRTLFVIGLTGGTISSPRRSSQISPKMQDRNAETGFPEGDRSGPDQLPPCLHAWARAYTGKCVDFNPNWKWEWKICCIFLGHCICQTGKIVLFLSKALLSPALERNNVPKARVGVLG
jgi:hypothetical protein